MACSCKSNGTSKQVTSVKQVVKKEKDNSVMASSRPQRRPLMKRMIIK